MTENNNPRSSDASMAPRPPSPARGGAVQSRERLAPMTTLVSSAKRLSAAEFERGAGRTPSTQRKTRGWQSDAWEMYDLVGEQRFLSSTLAGQMSRAKFYIGKVDRERPEQEPERVEDPAINELLTSLGRGASGLRQLVERFGINLFVAGEVWLFGLAPTDDDGDDLASIDVTEIEWRALSTEEFHVEDGMVKIHDDSDRPEGYHLDSVYLVRIWRPHPRKWAEADSPTRASLPVLRELVGLTMHISAQVDSRLAGAGLLIIPESVERAMKIARGLPEESEDSPFTDALLEAMVTPIEDRSSAAAIVPLVVTAPDASVDSFKHLTFDQPLDDEARELRDESIRRLALGQDAPPELLLGVGGMNHWGAWLVREDVVTTHLEPPLSLICDALTAQYLRPMLLDTGLVSSEEEADQYVIWFDVDHMIMRPNRGTDALQLYDRGALSERTLRDANGFEESDAPEEGAEAELSVSERALEIALKSASTMPGLLADPGLPELVRQIVEALTNAEEGSSDAPETLGSPDIDSEPSATDGSGDDAPPPIDESGQAGPPAEAPFSLDPTGGESADDVRRLLQAQAEGQW